MTLRALVLWFAATPLLAAAGTSANYTLAVGTFDGGGGKGVTANYEIDFSMGPGESGASLNDRLRTGFAGGLMDAVALEIDRSAAPWSFHELTTRQLAAHLVFDDDTLLALSAAESGWSVVSGPITEVDAAGIATAAAVYQDTPAVVGASHLGFSSTRVFSILNVGNTITFGALSAVTYGDAPFTLTATASSGLTVAYTSSNPAVATIDGSTVTIVGAGSTTITASQVGDATYAAATPIPRALTVNAAGLAGGDITLTPVGDGSYTASGPEGSTFSIGYSGRTANGITTTYSSATVPTAAGYYTATATATGNYTGSNSSNFFVTGPIAANDAVSKIAAETAIVIEGSLLLTNDRRIDASGNVQTGGLALSGATAGAGNAAQLDGSDVLFEVLSGASPWTFTYTLTDTVANKTASATVTVGDGATVQPFSLQIVRIGTATFNGTNTSLTHDFIGVPNQTYFIEYSTDLATWTSVGNQSTGASGSFSVTIARAGNVASAWNSAMFFRARLVTP